MVRELQRGMQGCFAVALLTHVERRLRGIAEGALEKMLDYMPGKFTK